MPKSLKIVLACLICVAVGGGVIWVVQWLSG
jgi:hypothetical protein